MLAAATAAKLLQSCPTLCDPIDGSPPVSPVPGSLQARILEWAPRCRAPEPTPGFWVTRAPRSPVLASAGPRVCSGFRSLRTRAPVSLSGEARLALRPSSRGLGVPSFPLILLPPLDRVNPGAPTASTGGRPVRAGGGHGGFAPWGRLRSSGTPRGWRCARRSGFTCSLISGR